MGNYYHPSYGSQEFAIATDGIKPTVLLPQMFGPFDNQEKTEAFRPILEKSGLIYAREQASYDCLSQINSTNRPIGMAPDITIFSPSLPPSHYPDTRYACLIPNMRMRDKAKDTWGENYIEAMVQSAKRLSQSEVHPYLVIHDGGKEDIVLGREIAEKASLPEESIYFEEDPRKIKGFIKGADLLIGSRFHALVAALSSGTPAIALGWAHKYESLLTDFGVPDYCCSHTQGVSYVLDSLDKLLDPKINSQVASVLAEKKESMRVDSDRMWQQVAQHLGLSPCKDK